MVKSQAKEHIQSARELASLLEQYNVRVTTVTTRRPGYVVYEDEHQLVAEPFGETLDSLLRSSEPAEHRRRRRDVIIYRAERPPVRADQHDNRWGKWVDQMCAG